MLFRIALRNVLRNRRRSILTGLMMVGGFVLISASLALLEGSYGGIINIFTNQYTGQARISKNGYLNDPTLYKTVKNYDEIISRIKKNNKVRAAAPRIHSEALVYLKNKTYGAEIVGVDPLLEDIATHYSKRISKGKAFDKDSEYEAVVGKGIAKVLDVSIGEDIILLSQGADGSIANDIFKVKGIIGTEDEGRDDYRIYIPLKSAQEFFALEGRVHEISVFLKDINYTDRFVQDLVLYNKELTVHSWKDIEKDFYKAMMADRNGNDFSSFIIMLMVGFGVLNTILMSTLERTREFAVLKAMGTVPKRLFSMIVIESVILSSFSIIIASIVAYGLNTFLSFHGFKFEEPIRFAGMLISEFNAANYPGAFIFPALIVIFTAIIASLYPGIRASKTKVAKALREY